MHLAAELRVPRFPAELLVGPGTHSSHPLMSRNCRSQHCELIRLIRSTQLQNAEYPEILSYGFSNV